MNKILITALTIFTLIGIFFTGVMVEEVFHSIHMKGATEICVSTNLKMNDSIQNGYLIAYTKFNISEYKGVEEYKDIRQTSEKIASIGSILFVMLISWAIGFGTGKHIK